MKKNVLLFCLLFSYTFISVTVLAQGRLQSIEKGISFLGSNKSTIQRYIISKGFSFNNQTNNGDMIDYTKEVNFGQCNFSFAIKNQKISAISWQEDAVYGQDYLSELKESNFQIELHVVDGSQFGQSDTKVFSCKNYSRNIMVNLMFRNDESYFTITIGKIDAPSYSLSTNNSSNKTQSKAELSEKKSQLIKEYKDLILGLQSGQIAFSKENINLSIENKDFNLPTSLESNLNEIHFTFTNIDSLLIKLANRNIGQTPNNTITLNFDNQGKLQKIRNADNLVIIDVANDTLLKNCIKLNEPLRIKYNNKWFSVKYDSHYDFSLKDESNVQILNYYFSCYGKRLFVGDYERIKDRIIDKRSSTYGYEQQRFKYKIDTIQDDVLKYFNLTDVSKLKYKLKNETLFESNKKNAEKVLGYSGPYLSMDVNSINNVYDLKYFISNIKVSLINIINNQMNIVGNGVKTIVYVPKVYDFDLVQRKFVPMNQ
jgi:hypothetical protein